MKAKVTVAFYSQSQIFKLQFFNVILLNYT